VDRIEARALFKEYDAILRTLVGMIAHADTWVLPLTPKSARDRADS
jgi:hypothetical protein